MAYFLLPFNTKNYSKDKMYMFMKIPCLSEELDTGSR